LTIVSLRSGMMKKGTLLRQAITEPRGHSVRRLGARRTHRSGPEARKGV
jgi:hypothetical protein